jgi:DNA-binding NtrC family response regulator
MATQPVTEIIAADSGGEELRVQSARLSVTRGPDRGKRIDISARGIRVGTDPDCDLVLTDAAVSAAQLELRPSARGFLLVDAHSTNGTFIGSLRVREAVLSERATLLVGRSTLRFEPKAEHQSFALSPHQRFGTLIGQSASMRRAFALLEAAATTDSTVLLEGESGTGKELAARGLHEASARRTQPFVVVDCGAMPRELIESELFGHERGAFTGAVSARPGALATADGGTLFLDEIGELDLALQPRLLRFLESREVRRVGAETSTALDVRVVAATHRRLEQLVAAGGFRQDLFFRLAVIRCELPPLRERPDDLPLLALELARRLRPDVDPASWLDAGTLAVLATHSWPGNVRELRNVLERLAALPQLPVEQLFSAAPADGGQTTASLGALGTLPYHQAKEQVLDAFERRYVEALLAAEGGVVARAADRAQVPRQTFFRLIKKHGLRGE